MANLWDRMFNILGFYYYQYTLVTALYMLESWERKLFNCLLITFIAMASYTTYLFLPGHIAMWKRAILCLLNVSQQDSTADMNL